MIFTIPFEYCVSKRDKITKWSGGRVALSDRYRESQHAVHLIALAQAREVEFKPIPKQQAVRVDFVIHFPSGRQKDPANYTESILDALQRVGYEDDCQVVEMSVTLAGYDQKNPRIKVTVTDLNRLRPLPPSKQPKTRRQPKEQ